MITQNTWRCIGVVSIAAAAFMAWRGADEITAETPRLYLLAYWGVFTLLLCAAIWMALLDLRYIRMQYRMGQRELFQTTVDTEELRATLAKMIQAKTEAPSDSVPETDHASEDKVRRN